MEIKQTEFTSVEKNLKKVGHKIESLYKPNIVKKKETLIELKLRKKKLTNNLNDYIIKKEQKQAELAKIKEIYLKAMDNETLNNLEENIDDFVQERKQGCQQAQEDIQMINEYKDLIDIIDELENSISHCKFNIQEVEQVIENRIKTTESKKANFSINYTRLVDKLCEFGKVNIQQAKVKFAGKKIALKGKMENHLCDKTLSAADLKAINKIAELLETKLELEKEYSCRSESLEKSKVRTELCKNDYLEKRKSFDDLNLFDEISEENEKIKQAEKAKAKANKMKLLANILGLDSNNQISLAIDNEINNQTATCKESLAISKEKYKNAETLLSLIGDKKETFDISNSNMCRIKQQWEKLSTQLNVIDEKLLQRLQIILNTPKINPITGLEMIMEILEQTPFKVDVPAQLIK